MPSSAAAPQQSTPPPMNAAFDMRRTRHAIGEFSATLKFFQAVSSNTFAKVKQTAQREATRLELPVPIRQQTFQFAIGPNVQLPPAQMPEGFGFHSFARTGEIETAILCEPDGVVLTLHDYDSWQIVHPMIVETLGNLAEEYLTEVPAVRSFAVQYLNEFKSHEPGNVSTAEVFKPNRWLPKFGVEGDQPWHCHSGVFIPRDARSRFLVNVNFDIGTSLEPTGAPHTLLKLLILVSLNFDVQGQPPLTVAVGDAREVLKEISDTVHGVEKDVLGEVLSEDYLKMVGAIK